MDKPTFDDEPGDFDPGDDDGYCDRCGGDGWIITCCDDLCHGAGYCMHGDGMVMCPCNKSGEPPADAPREWEPPDIEGFEDCNSPFHPGCRKCEVKDPK